jgi:hypothetical protein
MRPDIQRFYEGRVRPELNAYQNLTLENIEGLINQLPDGLMWGGNEIIINFEDKAAMIQAAAREFNLEQVQHVYVRGVGIYRNDEVIELDKTNWTYYHKHRGYLADNVFTGAPDVISSIDYETDEIIKRIPNPILPGNDQFLCKGLVIGYVQSGKTANFTHLISKAASIGYKFIIVLGGMTNTLRAQTQYRLDKELTGNNTYGTNEQFVRWLPGENRYRSITSGPDYAIGRDGDFHYPVENFTTLFSNQNDVVIAVVKKLARSNDDGSFGSVLGRIINYIENRVDPEMELPPLLIIDDEADQAGVDANTDPDANPTVINHAIRKLLSLFPKRTYVGYTATPFANVFINADAEFEGLPDLYPDDFIYSLPEPRGYFGNRQFFGLKRNLHDHDEFAYIVNVPDDEKDVINHPGQGITDSLYNAFWDFIFSVIIRRYREDDRHVGFMIHTDHRNDIQDIVFRKVEELIESLRMNLIDGQIEQLEILDQRWESYLDRSREIQELSGLDYVIPAFNQLELTQIVLETLNNVDLRLINGLNDRLDYINEDLKELICIGGNLMSRGVTVEGLTISYYLRDTPKYDTLLQMGRWFGYRNGYEDLLRIYTTYRIQEHFEFIVGVEDDLRNEVEAYKNADDVTPRDFAPKVRAHMTMMPSYKMGSAKRQRSYSRQTVQTIYFHRDVETLRRNHIMVYELVENYFENVQKQSGGYRKESIPATPIMDFLNHFVVCDPEIGGFDKGDMLRYLNIRINSNEITHFDVLIAGRSTQRADSLIDDLPYDLTVFPVKRNARKGTGWNKLNDGFVNVGVITDTADIPDPAIGLERPLLIIYSLDRMNSDAFKVTENANGEIHAQEQVINGLNFNPNGYAVVFPRSNAAHGEYDYYQQIFQAQQI